jgi:uncharacterized protein YkwD
MSTTVPGGIKRIIASTVAIAALAGVFGFAGGARPAEALTNCNVEDMTFDAQEQQFLKLINQYRAQNGKSALTVSTNLNRAATWMARDLAVNRYFSHTDSLGRSPTVRSADCGAQPYTGENLAAGTVKDTAAEAFEMWKKSAGHNKNMLHTDYKQIGIARYYDSKSTYGWYWATEFSTSVDGTSSGGSTGGSTPAPTPSPTPSAQPPAAQTSPIGVMTSPVAGSTLTSSTRFAWNAGSDSSAYHIYLGTSKGASNILSYAVGKSTAITVNNLPKTGKTLYVRLWSMTSSGWKYSDYTYVLPR